jgi:hypothetical protein
MVGNGELPPVSPRAAASYGGTPGELPPMEQEPMVEPQPQHVAEADRPNFVLIAAFAVMAIAVLATQLFTPQLWCVPTGAHPPA